MLVVHVILPLLECTVSGLVTLTEYGLKDGAWIELGGWRGYYDGKGRSKDLTFSSL